MPDVSVLHRFTGDLGSSARRSRQIETSVIAHGLIVPIYFEDDEKGPTMKLATIALATALALSSTAVLAQSGTTYGQPGASIGTVTAPSVGSYYWPSVGTTNAVPTWSNTGPRVSSAPAPGAPAIGTAPFSSGVRR
jgi:hypothetical protein